MTNTHSIYKTKIIRTNKIITLNIIRNSCNLITNKNNLSLIFSNKISKVITSSNNLNNNSKNKVTMVINKANINIDPDHKRKLIFVDYLILC